MAFNLEKYYQLADKYRALVIILNSVLEKIGTNPYMISEDPSKVSEFIIEWQKGIKDEINKLGDLLIKEQKKQTMDSSVGIEEARSNNPDDYLVVEDKKKSTTWHLQVKVDGKPDHRLMGAAWAALHGGYRGNKYEGPNKQEAIKKLKALYKSEKMTTPGE